MQSLLFEDSGSITRKMGFMILYNYFVIQDTPLPKMYINIYTSALTVRRTHLLHVPIRPENLFEIPCLFHKNHETNANMVYSPPSRGYDILRSRNSLGRKPCLFLFYNSYKILFIILKVQLDL